MEEKVQSRKWLLTINNPLDHGFTHDHIKNQLEKFKGLKYWCMCDEIGKNKTYHTHIYIYSSGGIRFSRVKKLFSSAHIDYCRGTSQENRDYLRKEGKYKGGDKEETNLKDTFEESGDMPIERQGQRNDLIDLYDMIKSGLSNYEILEENPEFMLQIDKIERCRQIVRQEAFKNTFRDLHVEYYCGKTGKGKTRSVLEQYGYENVYRVTDYLHPFDAYKGQDVIVFEEFRSSLKIQDMLNYLDGYPLELPCRYSNKVACYTKVYILSNVGLQDQYRDVKREYEETWHAFIRRIHKVKVFEDDRVVTFDTPHDYLYGFHPVNEKEIPFKSFE